MVGDFGALSCGPARVVESQSLFACFGRGGRHGVRTTGTSAPERWLARSARREQYCRLSAANR
eukprot:1389156-Pleurochrysis_carterae.AAC.1